MKKSEAIMLFGAVAIGISAVLNQKNSDLDTLQTELSNFRDHLGASIDASESRLDRFFNELNEEICASTAQALNVLDSNKSISEKTKQLKVLGFVESDIQSILTSGQDLVQQVREEQKLCP